MGTRTQAQCPKVVELLQLERCFEKNFLPMVLQLVLGGFIVLAYFRGRYADGGNIVELIFLKDSAILVVTKTKTSGSNKSRLPLELVAPKRMISGIKFL